LSSQCDIYRLNGAWQASPQPLCDFYPGTLLKSFSLFGENETANISKGADGLFLTAPGLIVYGSAIIESRRKRFLWL
jgi:hypothetical protein